MNYDKIMALSVTELDVAVAERVMGLSTEAGDSVPNYSSDISASFGVMRLVLSHSYAARETFYSYLWLQAGIQPWHTTTRDEAFLARRWCESALTKLVLENKLAEAICRAAVLAASQPWWATVRDLEPADSDVDDTEVCPSGRR